MGRLLNNTPILHHSEIIKLRKVDYLNDLFIGYSSVSLIYRFAEGIH